MFASHKQTPHSHPHTLTLTRVAAAVCWPLEAETVLIFYAIPRDHHGCHDNQASQLTPIQPLIREHTFPKSSFIGSSKSSQLIPTKAYTYIYNNPTSFILTI